MPILAFDHKFSGIWHCSVCKEIALARVGTACISTMGLALEYRWQWTLHLNESLG